MTAVHDGGYSPPMNHFLSPTGTAIVTAAELAVSKLAAEINPHLVAGRRQIGNVPLGIAALVAAQLTEVGWTVEVAPLDAGTAEIRVSIPIDREQTIIKVVP